MPHRHSIYLFLLPLLALLLPTPLKAQFTYVTNNNAITITGYTSPGGALTIPDTINSYPVTSIASMAFANDSLTGITISTNVTGIGDGAFSNCTALASVIIPGSVTNLGASVFYKCSSLAGITVPGSVNNIGQTAFAMCTSLATLTVSNGVNSIGEDAFFFCTNLYNVNLQTGLGDIGGYVFFACDNMTNIVIPNSVTNMGNGIFYECTNLTSISIPDGVTNIGSSEFQDCISLTNIVIPGSVINIEEDAFLGCSSLGSLNLSNGVASIGDGAFSGCISLTSLTIPTNVMSIGVASFANCTNLAAVAFSNGIASIGEEAFENCTNLTSLIIPNTVTNLGDGVFTGCSGLANVVIGNGVTIVGGNTFENCIRLAGISIGSGVTNLAADVFSTCPDLTAISVDPANLDYSSLKGVLFDRAQATLLQYPVGLTNSAYTIPNGVINIGVNAFYGCASLTSITLPASVTNLENLAFGRCPVLTAAYFEGNAPAANYTAFFVDPLMAYYLPGSTGWTAFAGNANVTTQLWPAGVAINASPVNAPVGVSIQFSCPGVDTNGDAITNWSWNFGDGAASTNQNPLHIYTTTGSYAPYLIAINGLGAFDPGYAPAISIFPTPSISYLNVSKTNLVITGTNGCAGLTYYILATTNLTEPTIQWTPIATNTWSANGGFNVTVTNAVKRSTPVQFYRIQVP